MCTLLNTLTHKSIVLASEHVFGRQIGACAQILHSPEASRIHASIFWNGDSWFLHDSSKNGTYINSLHVVRGKKMRLDIGDRIRFGSENSETWAVLDISAPKPMLIPITPGLAAVQLDDIELLPDDKAPEIILYASIAGEWTCESAAGVATLNTGDRVGINAGQWRFVDAKPSVDTQSMDEDALVNVSHIETHFNVSQNEEHVSLKLKIGSNEVDLGQRNHHYLMLLLARKRLSDRDAGIAASEQGWMDKELLVKAIGLSENHINILIYRFRKQMLGALPSTLRLPQAIERRTGEIRFAYDFIEIGGGALFGAKAAG